MFKPVKKVDGFLPLEDFGLIGDGATAALVGRDGSIPWLCVPRFDSPPLFCGILDAKIGGSFDITPDSLVDSRHAYDGDSGVLVTEMRSKTGIVQVVDCLTLRSGADLSEDAPAHRGELLRRVSVVGGHVDLVVSIQPRGGCRAERRGEGLELYCAELPHLVLHLWSSMPLQGLESRYHLVSGQGLDVMLCWSKPGSQLYRCPSPEHIVLETRKAWHVWSGGIQYDGPQPAHVRRSAITLKLLTHLESGAIVAAPTSSLPERIGGTRNWDYRFGWIRDASFSMYALRRLGLFREDRWFLSWVLNAVSKRGELRVLFDLDGNEGTVEHVDERLSGYRGSRPVRWGNAAAQQTQNDCFGEVLDCAWMHVSSGGVLDAALWGQLRTLAEHATRVWRKPDQGIWEVRTPGRVFTYSAAMCQVALARAIRLSERCGLPGNTAAWRRSADEIVQAILEEAWDPQRQTLTQCLGGASDGPDASLLLLPLRRVIAARHPRMESTTRAIASQLNAGRGLLYRYRPDRTPDGLPGLEGAFIACSFWMVEILARQGHVEEAAAMFDSLCLRCNDLGLLSEEILPGSGTFLGNFPQALSHVGLISAGAHVAYAMRHPVAATA